MKKMILVCFLTAGCFDFQTSRDLGVCKAQLDDIHNYNQQHMKEVDKLTKELHNITTDLWYCQKCTNLDGKLNSDGMCIVERKR